MNDAMKKLLIPVAVILVAALVLFAATAGLAGTASANEQAKLDEILGYMIPGGGEYAEEEYTGSNSSITGVYRGEEGVVVEMVVGGFANDIHMLVAVRNDGTVTGVSILDSHETYGLGQEAKGDWDFLIDMLNSQGDLAVNSNIDSITGATITSSAVVSAVNAASQFVLDSAAASGPLTGTADGFMGPITVEVTMDGDTITGVTVVSNSETPSIAGNALEQIPAAIVAANSADVDIVAGATFTSNGIINAVKNAISGSSPAAEPEETEEPEDDTPQAVEAAEAYQGFGLSNTVRMGPGEDDTGTPVYSINQVFANTLFDDEGRIVAIYVDQLEYATPNYDGAEMPHFSGWPGQGGYNNDSDHDAVVDGVTPDTEEQFTSEVEGWVTKRDRGDTYVMGTGTWHEQMDAFQELFIGMTVDEVQEWFDKYCSDANGRPLKEGSEAEGDAEKYAALSDEEKEMLVDVTSSATMSLNDSHGNILAAILDSFEDQVPVDITVG